MFSGLSFFDKHIKIRYLLRVIQEGNKMFDTRGWNLPALTPARAERVKRSENSLFQLR